MISVAGRLGAALLSLTICALAEPSSALDKKPGGAWSSAVVYQIFPRSYRDSNGDRIGDLVGIEQGLPTIQNLGCTAILLNPIWKSPFYHGYFSSGWMSPDPAYGTLAAFRSLVLAAHRRRIKIILDVEPQYVADGHPWMEAFKKHPNSPDAKKLARGVSSMFGRSIPMYNGKRVEIALVDLNNPEARAGVKESFLFWTRLGVDGFRLDHMMDDLDLKHVDTNLFKNLWIPIEDATRKINPNAFFVGEQADWGYGAEILSQTPTDAVFGFPLCGAIRSFDKSKIEEAIRKQATLVPDGKTVFTFLENHDVQRFATGEKDPRRLRLGMQLLMTLAGTPVIYQGQELGMKGDKGQWRTDGNDIPIRLAYRWSKTLDGPGTPTWYKDTGPWWTNQYSSDNDGISLEEEQGNPKSLFNLYRQMIRLRRRHPALTTGTQELVNLSSPTVLGFRRSSNGKTVTVYANLSANPVTVKTEYAGTDLITGVRQAAGTVGLGPYELKAIESHR